MKIVVIGGTGLIGSKTVERLRKKGHEVLAASPNSGVNTVTGEGLAEALAGAQVVIDLANSPSFEEKAAMDFFEAAGRNLFAAEKTAGVRHHVALSVVGTDRMQAMGYFRAKLRQEEHIRNSGIPYTIVHATQFFEFVGAIAQSATEGTDVRAPTGAFQPVAADNVADTMADAALAEPLNGVIEIAGPELAPMNEFIARYLKATNDRRILVADPHARYFEVEINDRTLVPGEGARLGSIRFEDWLQSAAAQKK
ncbi:SDR family oxidoreductase [Phyllobacterium endophyticum]|uniref:SDR family oxidoreductase n=1 Tax=Phyllobacterium endophyticum TaxID=1149773 RepID=UPI0011CA88CE|nr:SDR family oxidoreductase [Phyllobacterium endophyticum]TXR47625.1 SDR family oxidoreductase [Phyllobacterium endophyticum]